VSYFKNRGPSSEALVHDQTLLCSVKSANTSSTPREVHRPRATPSSRPAGCMLPAASNQVAHPPQLTPHQCTRTRTQEGRHQRHEVGHAPPPANGRAISGQQRPLGKSLCMGAPDSSWAFPPHKRPGLHVCISITCMPMKWTRRSLRSRPSPFSSPTAREQPCYCCGSGGPVSSPDLDQPDPWRAP
jgi:hypothetical protein